MGDEDFAKPTDHVARLRQAAKEIEAVALPKRWSAWLLDAADELHGLKGVLADLDRRTYSVQLSPDEAAKAIPVIRVDAPDYIGKFNE